MKSEIGSNFWEYDLNKKRKIKFWWESPEFNKIFLKSGRNAFKAISDNIKVNRKNILFPAYHCETESEPWYENGWKVDYYSIETDFSVNPEKLEQYILDYNPSVIVIQSYFGFEALNSKCDDVLRKYKNKGGIIIEDITQSLISNIRHTVADYYVASFRKFFAIPDGGVLISRQIINIDNIEPSNEELTQIALKAYDLKKQYFQIKNKSIKDNFRKLYLELNDLISENDKLVSMSDIGLEILNGVEAGEITERRQQNYKYLYEKLSKINFLYIPRYIEDIAICPLFLPVLISENKCREDLQKYLAQNDIYCPIIWKKSHNIEKCSLETQKIYDHILCFPIDQRYDYDDMQRIVSVLREWK